MFLNSLHVCLFILTKILLKSQCENFTLTQMTFTEIPRLNSRDSFFIQICCWPSINEWYTDKLHGRMMEGLNANWRTVCMFATFNITNSTIYNHCFDCNICWCCLCCVCWLFSAPCYRVRICICLPPCKPDDPFWGHRQTV